MSDQAKWWRIVFLECFSVSKTCFVKESKLYNTVHNSHVNYIFKFLQLLRNSKVFLQFFHCCILGYWKYHQLITINFNFVHLIIYAKLSTQLIHCCIFQRRLFIRILFTILPSIYSYFTIHFPTFLLNQ